MEGWLEGLVSNMYLTIEEVERLKQYIDSEEERIKEAKRIVCKNTFDFEVWYKYSIREERCEYPSMLGIDTMIGKLINNKMPWLKEGEFKGMILTLDYILQSMENLNSLGELTSEEIDRVKRDIVRLNFGSMINKW